MDTQDETGRFEAGVSEEIVSPDVVANVQVASRLTFPERAVRLAVKHIGVHETPLGSNRVVYNRYWSRMDGVPWCASALSYWLDRVGNKNHQIAWDNPYAVASIAAWAAANGRFVSTPRRGDIYLVSNARMSHCGLVRKVAGTRFLDVSGNTSYPGRHGPYYVASKWRATRMYRFVRLPDRPF
jgi:hypothetical protein